MRKDFPVHSIAVYHGDCNKILREQILPQLPYESKKRAIAFIDPFGMQFDWQTMEALAAVRTVESVLNFPVMAINRGVLRKNPKMISEIAKNRLDHFWGTTDWMVDLYEEEQTLFGPEKVKKQLSGKEFGRVFKKRPEEIFPRCFNPILMANSKNALLYCLIFAGHNATGKKIAQDSIPPGILRRIFFRYPQNAEFIIRKVLNRPDFNLQRDFDCLMDEFKPSLKGKRIYPQMLPMSDRMVKALRPEMNQTPEPEGKIGRNAPAPAGAGRNIRNAAGNEEGGEIPSLEKGG